MENSEVSKNDMKVKKSTPKVYIKGINFLTPKIKMIHRIKVVKNKIYFQGDFMGVFTVKEIEDSFRTLWLSTEHLVISVFKDSAMVIVCELS